MKKRIFYVINLDRGRLWILAILLVSTLLFAFATGFRVGQARANGMPGEQLSAASDGAFEQLAELPPLDAESENEIADNPDGADGEAELSANLDRDGADSESGSRLSLANESSSERSGRSPFEIDDRRERSTPEPVRRAQPEPDVIKKKQTQSAPKKSTNAERKSERTPAPSADKKLAQKKSETKQNPRSALLESGSEKLRMSNISKAKPKSPTVDEQKSTRTYSLQLGAFSSEGAANRMAATLKKQGFHPYIVQSKNRYLVRVGRSDSAKGLWPLESGLREKQYAPMRVSSKAAN